MRVQSTSIIGSLVAMAIAAIAEARPGGAPALTGSEPAGLTDRQRYQWFSTRRLKPFAAYVIHAGHPELAEMAHAQEAAGEAVHVLSSQAEPKALYSKLIPHTDLWIAGEIMLAVIFWLLLLGGAARLLARRAAFRESRPLLRSLKWGIGFAFYVPLAVAGFNTGNVVLQTSIFLISLVLGVLGTAVLFLLRRRITRPALARFARAFLLTLFVLAGSAGIFSWQGHGIGEAWEGVVSLFRMSGDNDSGAQIGMDFWSLLLLVTLALPALMLLIFALWGRVRRVPVSVAVVRGFLSSAVPIACVLLLVWGGLCLVTVRQERQINAELDRMITHEGRYYASLAGAQWPGPAVP